MARAVNQSVAWIVALLLSLMVFGAGLAIVFSLHPKRKDSEANADSHKSNQGSAHGDHAEEGSHEVSSKNSHGSDHSDTAQKDSHETKAETHGAPAEHSAKKPEAHGKAHAVPEEAEEKEISAASLKAKAPSHEEPVPEAKPHH